jgi:hypothetical protein
MRTITGQFGTSNGNPAAFGYLNLELIREPSEDEQEDIVPFGELAESLKIPIDAEDLKDWREVEKSLGRTDEQIAADEAIEFKQKYDIPDSYDFRLDAYGRIRAGTQVIGNDELSGDTSYRITVTATADTSRGFNPVCFRETPKITGDSPVDLNEIASRKPQVDPDAHLSPRERALKAVDAAIMRDGSVRISKKNRIGFFAGIHCPTSSAGSVSLPSSENGQFGVFPFTLPFSAVVNRVSILVDTAGKGAVAIGIYDAGGTKRGDVAIDLSRSGLATGIFPDKVDLCEGDYFLAYGTDTVCDAQLRGIGVIDQLNLLNASGVPLMGTGRSQPGHTLPVTLGVIIPNAPRPEYGTNPIYGIPNSMIYGPAYAPILVYLKA